MTSFSAYHFPVLFQNLIFVTESIFYKHYFFHKFSFSSQNLFLLSIIQHVIASKSNHINIMLPNEMVLAPLQKLKMKYELYYQCTTRLKYISYHVLWPIADHTPVHLYRVVSQNKKKPDYWFSKYNRVLLHYSVSIAAASVFAPAAVVAAATVVVVVVSKAC